MGREVTRTATGGRPPQGAATFFLCDVAGFSDAARADPVRVRVRKAMYEGLDQSLAVAGVRLDDCYHEDRGDGVMVILPPHIKVESLLTGVIDRLRSEVRHHNEASSEAARMRLRVAVNVGEAESDGRGIVSTALTHTFRLLDAAPLKDAVREADTGIAVIVSRRVYDDVVRHGRGQVDPGDYYRVRVEVKETVDEAWVMVPGVRPVVPPPRSPASGSPAVPERDAELPGNATAPPPEPSMAQKFQTVEDLLEIPRLRTERGRDQLVGALSADIAGAVPRSGEARPDLFAILQTCLDYPGGLQQLLQAVQGFVGESLAVRRLEQSIAGMLRPPRDDR
ncbi:hypothetical protein BZB76_1897 [Actinomadura pelletieri DSM 43383]|uniref:Effector-associated domain-containing protein n=1 Tax=Actinomadura pelletieri DSM 43383 TaxID=1120940 RepID=A0A495QT06_9ACTN|nr:hypothetical protein [Actinomadura pelletieri]RKS76541.1 hypothetical protein BZB76_1897 [Actinomadura pelletieri DSM 43383]